MLPHQLNMLSSVSAHVDNVLLLQNRPPWLESADTHSKVEDLHAGFSSSPCDSSAEANDMRMLVGSQRTAAVQKVDYARLNDPDFLSQFFTISEVDGESDNRVGMAVGSLLRNKRGLEAGRQSTARFMGLLSFLDACVNADASELCVFLDPGVFLARSGASSISLVDLAPPIFAANPGWVALQPPGICHYHEFSDMRTKGCRAEPVGTLSSSSHHMVVNRTRLVQVLPLPLAPPDFSENFDKVWGAALAAMGGMGQMLCGGETCAIHPDHVAFASGAGTSASKDATGTDVESVAPAEFLQEWGEGAEGSLRGKKTSPDHKGLGALLDCLQSGRLLADSHVKCTPTRSTAQAMARSGDPKFERIAGSSDHAEAIIEAEGGLLLRLASSNEKQHTKSS